MTILTGNCYMKTNIKLLLTALLITALHSSATYTAIAAADKSAYDWTAFMLLNEVLKPNLVSTDCNVFNARTTLIPSGTTRVDLDDDMLDQLHKHAYWFKRAYTQFCLAMAQHAPTALLTAAAKVTLPNSVTQSTCDNATKLIIGTLFDRYRRFKDSANITLPSDLTELAIAYRNFMRCLAERIALWAIDCGSTTLLTKCLAQGASNILELEQRAYKTLVCCGMHNRESQTNQEKTCKAELANITLIGQTLTALLAK
jgi:hypothetical protein